MNTAQSFTATDLVIGMAIEGGFFSGIIQLPTGLHGLVMSPAAGDLDESPWGESGQLIEGATSCFDGMTNTQAMAESGSDLAQRILALDISGLKDWYIPARDELELMYRNLKPTTRANFVSFRDGDNASSVPAGYPYTKEEPAQTSVAALREGSPDALRSAVYWASTQYSANYAWDQCFADGNQLNCHKGNAFRARAVRRFLIN
ncbi:Lcl C-terminal domain-containing protein [Alloalcanivorax xenomutans]